MVLVGRYQLLEQVGEGGMGVVWRAHDVKLERDVAIKLLRPSVAGEPAQRRRFHREARTLAGLADDHIVRVFDYVDAGELAFLVMEYLDGGNLAETTFGRLPLPVAAAAAYAAPVAQALAYAHGRGVVHRDLTPANILIERASGRVVTTDFGLARIARSGGSLTAPGVLLGTPEYWSPEQALGRETGAAADMYALGCILFLLLSGRLPFEGEDRLAVGLRRAHEDAPSLHGRVPGGTAATVVTLVDSLLAREPGRRPDAAETAAVLAGFSSSRVPRAERRPTNEVSGAPTAVLPPAAEPPHGFSRRLFATFVAALVTTAGLLFLVGGLRHRGAEVPNVVGVEARLARTEILHRVSSATVSVTHAYSTRVAAGRVISQRPRPRARLGRDRLVRLVVSKGTPFARVPEIAVGEWASNARAALERSGFRGRLRYRPSWTVRKGAMIALRPATGTRLRRPATVKIIVASGYPRAVVPDVRSTDLATAQTRLVAKHLSYRIVYRLAQSVPANQVLAQIPSAGATVYKGTRVRLTVARALRWVPVLAQSGTNAYESDPFTVPGQWRIRYRLAPGGYGPAFAQFSWSRDGSFGDGGFIADTPGATRTYTVPDGAGTFRLAVSPYAGTAWYVEVDALR